MVDLAANRVQERWRRREPVFGTYVTLPALAAVEVCALGGLDFVRIDAYHIAFDPETLYALVQTAYAYGITPWMRVKNDPLEIARALDLGVQAITIPNMGTADAARAAVSAAFYPPRGTREMSRPVRARGVSGPEYFQWAAENVIVSCQVEGADGLENYREIVKVEGLGVIQTGRGDLSLALGVPGEEFHPKVLEAERRIVDAALEAGKQVSLVSPPTPEGFERMARYTELGVLIHTIDSDYRTLMRAYADAVEGARAAIQARSLTPA